MLKKTLAQKIGQPELRINGIIAAMRRLLNVDGYGVLSMEEATDRGAKPRIAEDSVRFRAESEMGSPQRQRETIDASAEARSSKRSGYVCRGDGPITEALDRELDVAAAGGSVFKAVRGEYGSGKTFFARWLQDRAKAEHLLPPKSKSPRQKRLTSVRDCLPPAHGESLHEGHRQGAFRSIIDGWFYTLRRMFRGREVFADDADMLLVRSDELMEQRLAALPNRSGFFRCITRLPESISGGRQLGGRWPSRLAHGTAQRRRKCETRSRIKGDIDHFGALSFLQGLLVVLRDSGHSGLVLVLDEVETLQSVRGDVREKALNALRQLIDEIDAGRFPGLYLIVTGTPSFYDGRKAFRHTSSRAETSCRFWN